jgi:hypothetical protein
MKRFLVVKLTEGLNQVASWIAIPGLYTLEAAQQLVDEALKEDPESNYMIQEVGTA